MLSMKQLKLLEDVIGPNGSHFLVIKAYEQIDLGTKVLYLTRALTHPLNEYLELLDKLYLPAVKDECQSDKLCALMRSFKTINDLYFNHTVNRRGKSLKTMHRYFFKGTGDVNVEEVQCYVMQCIQARICELSAGVADQVAFQSNQRQSAEAEMKRYTAWRDLLDLPRNQCVYSTPASLLFKTKDPAQSSFSASMGELVDLYSTYLGGRP